jgi:phosphatidylethanolamine/phosphatidyl-N-methylethanolamine N-methyltransferase
MLAMKIKFGRSQNKAKHRSRPHHFIAAWIRSPLQVGACLPSSRGLARAMASQVDAKISGAVIELGAGTGAVTQALLHAGIAPERLMIVERDERLHSLVSKHFPQLNVMRADAAKLDEVLQEEGIKKVSAIVSSLPLLSMPKAIRDAIEHQMLTLIEEQGVLIQFTYGPKSPISRAQLHKYHLQGKRAKLVVGNVPPAHVWVYKKA